MTDETETCLICGATATAAAAMCDGWIAVFNFSNNDDGIGPACAVCAKVYLNDPGDKYGKPTLKIEVATAIAGLIDRFRNA